VPRTHSPWSPLQAEAAEAQVPAAIVHEFVWRRARNYNATVLLLDLQAASVASGTPLFDSIYITQDDNALFGFNIAEAAALKALVVQLGLSQFVRIYPGADEVGLSMLARLTVDTVGAAEALALGLVAEAEAAEATEDASRALRAVHRRLLTPASLRPSAAAPLLTGPGLTLVFRDPSNASLHLVPNYEGQPLIDTLLDQIAAAGAVAVPGNWSALTVDAGADAAHRDGSGAAGRALRRRKQRPLPAPTAAPAVAARLRARLSIARPNVTMLINNFSDDPQIEAPNQPMAGRSPADYDMFTPLVCAANASSTSAPDGIAGFLNNRYSNGA
jgi:hypothetical protein